MAACRWRFLKLSSSTPSSIGGGGTKRGPVAANGASGAGIGEEEETGPAGASSSEATLDERDEGPLVAAVRAGETVAPSPPRGAAAVAALRGATGGVAGASRTRSKKLFVAEAGGRAAGADPRRWVIVDATVAGDGTAADPPADTDHDGAHAVAAVSCWGMRIWAGCTGVATRLQMPCCCSRTRGASACWDARGVMAAADARENEEVDEEVGGSLVGTASAAAAG